MFVVVLSAVFSWSRRFFCVVGYVRFWFGEMGGEARFCLFCVGVCGLQRLTRNTRFLDDENLVLKISSTSCEIFGFAQGSFVPATATTILFAQPSRHEENFWRHGHVGARLFRLRTQRREEDRHDPCLPAHGGSGAYALPSVGMAPLRIAGPEGDDQQRRRRDARCWRRGTAQTPTTK